MSIAKREGKIRVGEIFGKIRRLETTKLHHPSQCKCKIDTIIHWNCKTWRLFPVRSEITRVLDFNYDTADPPYRVLHISDAEAQWTYNSWVFSPNIKTSWRKQFLCDHPFFVEHVSPCLLRVISHEQCDSSSSLSIFLVNQVMTWFKLWPYLSWARTLQIVWYSLQPVWYFYAARERVKNETLIASKPFQEQCIRRFVFGVKRRVVEMGARPHCWAIEDDVQYLFWDAWGPNNTLEIINILLTCKACDTFRIQDPISWEKLVATPL